MTDEELAVAWKMAEYNPPAPFLPIEVRDMIRRLVSEIERLKELPDYDKRT